MAELKRLDTEAKAGRHVSRYTFALIRAVLGNGEQAFAELESAYLEHAWAMFALKVEPAFDGLRTDPRFTRLITALRL